MPDINQYASFLLRLQQVENNKHPIWIVSMQSTQTRVQHCFPDLDGLITFLQARFGDGIDTEPVDQPTGLETGSLPQPVQAPGKDTPKK